MTKTSTDPIARNAEIEQREPEAALRELRDAIAAVHASMEALARLYPGCTVMAGFARGEACLTVASSRSREFDHYLPSAMDAAKSLAQLVVGLPGELREVFEIELKYAAEIRRIKAEMEQAREAAIRAAAEGTRPA